MLNLEEEMPPSAGNSERKINKEEENKSADTELERIRKQIQMTKEDSSPSPT
jgi:hypothetical protein